MSTFGAEIEKPISDIETGQPKGVSQKFFKEIEATFEGSSPDMSDIAPETYVGVISPKIGHIGLDNGFNLQETSSRVTGSLEELEGVLQTDLKTIQKVLSKEGATVINLSIHPLGKTDAETHKAFVAPKGVYKYIAIRGWDHTAGIDAKAQNSPSTGVEPQNAARAVTTIIGSSAAFIGIFANSPFQEGVISQYKETRLKMWDRFMKSSISEGDRLTARFPDKPFNSLAEYFKWMFGPGTNIHFVIADDVNQNKSYKSFGDFGILIDNNPSVLEFLNLKKARGRFINSGKVVEIVPNMKHMETLQFAQFISARIRWKFDENLTTHDFLDAYRNNSLEKLFSNGGANNVYIEGRDAGANFPDAYLKSLGDSLAWSAVMGPSAIQAGLIANLEESFSFIQSFDWKHLNLLRESAIKDGLDGEVGGTKVSDFTRRVLDISARGLEGKDHRMLAYPEYVLKTKQNGADRALKDYEKGKSIQDIVKSRNVSVE